MQCKGCNEEVDELFSVTVAGKRKRVCEECVDRFHEAGEIDEAALEAMRQMMEYRGR